MLYFIFNKFYAREINDYCYLFKEKKYWLDLYQYMHLLSCFYIFMRRLSMPDS